MSVFGGDSWGREAQHRKRRVEELIGKGLNNNAYKKLSNGKFACLLCPNNLVFDSSLLLSAHNEGSRHVAAESRFKEKELRKQQEINKRIALSSDGSIDSASSYTCNCEKDKPLIEKTRKVVSQMLKQKPEQNRTNEHHNINYSGRNAFFNPPRSSSTPGKRTELLSSNLRSGCADHIEKSRGCMTEAAGTIQEEQGLDLMKRREKELKFTAAGWKRDCHGRWFRDENVEFDSDEEDPNVSLSSN